MAQQTDCGLTHRPFDRVGDFALRNGFSVRLKVSLKNMRAHMSTIIPCRDMLFVGTVLMTDQEGNCR